MVFLLSALLVGAPAWAKDACKDLKRIDDPLNGLVVSYSLPFGSYLSYGEGLTLKFEKAAWTLRFKPIVPGLIPAKAQAGELARLAVGSQIVELPARAEAVPTFQGGLSTWEVAYDVDREQLAAIAGAPITAIALSIGGQEYRMPLRANKAEAFQKILVCAGTIGGQGG